MTARPESSRVTIHRWVNTHRLPEPSLARASTRDVLERIDRSVASELAQRCAEALERRLRETDSQVWLIRRLDLEFTVDVSIPGAGAIAGAWSDPLARRIAGIIDSGAAEGVLSFPTRAAYLAQFIVDLAGGRAWSKWYYEEFRGLDQLTPSRAMREILTREPEDGLQTILHLEQSRHLEHLLSVVTEDDAQAIYQHCFLRPAVASAPSISAASASAPYNLSRWAGRILEILEKRPVRRERREKFHDALRLLAEAALRFDGAGRDLAAIEAVHGLLELREALAPFPSGIEADRLVRDLVGGKITLADAGALAANQGATSPENALQFLVLISAGDSHWASQAAAVLRRDQIPPVQAAIAGELILTPFGGVFLLGRTVIDLSLMEIAAACGPAEAGEAAGSFRHLVIAKSVGATHRSEAWADPALRLLSGCFATQPPAFAPADLQRAQAVFLENLIAFAGCPGRCLLAETIRLPSREILLLRDLNRNEWIYASPSAQPETLLAALDLTRELSGNVPHLLLRPPLAKRSPELHERTESVTVFDGDQIDDHFAELLIATRSIAQTTPRGKVLRLLAPVDQEFAYFSWPDLDTHADTLTALTARAMFRGFARRLTGFETASPEHLCANVLAGAGTIRSSPGRIDVELPSSPLSILLQLSGLTRQTYALPWLEGTQICLAPPPQ